MAGVAGSTLVAELNRLANGGTYPAVSNYVDMALAAKNWAAARAVTISNTDTVGILNDIAGVGNNPSAHLDFTGVCNLIAGTTRLTANAALQSIDEGA